MGLFRKGGLVRPLFQKLFSGSACQASSRPQKYCAFCLEDLLGSKRTSAAGLGFATAAITALFRRHQQIKVAKVPEKGSITREEARIPSIELGLETAGSRDNIRAFKILFAARREACSRPLRERGSAGTRGLRPPPVRLEGCDTAWG